MSSKPSSNGQANLGLFPNLRDYRVQRGLTVSELLTHIENPPSEKSVRRLESGKPIRLTTVHKIFNAISSLHGSLKREDEIVVVENS